MKSIFSLFVVVFSTFSIYSQVAVASAGGNFTSTGGSSSFTIGQISYTTFTGSNQSVAQGVQHPLEIQMLSDSVFLSENSIVSVYPNPTSENIFLEISDHFLDNFTYSLWDIKGEELSKGVIRDSKTTITIKNFANGIYFLKVTQQNVSNKVFKIIKK